jgi:hypothetical protein
MDSSLAHTKFGSLHTTLGDLFSPLLFFLFSLAFFLLFSVRQVLSFFSPSGLFFSVFSITGIYRLRAKLSV